MRHMARTLRINLDWLFERITDDPSIIIKYVSTKMQLADILTKAAFSVQQWNALLVLIQTRPYTKPLTAGPKASESASVCEYHWIGDTPGILPTGNLYPKIFVKFALTIIASRFQSRWLTSALQPQSSQTIDLQSDSMSQSTSSGNADTSVFPAVRLPLTPWDESPMAASSVRVQHWSIVVLEGMRSLCRLLSNEADNIVVSN